LPFSHDAFLEVFASYNRAWWPIAGALWIATLVAIVQLIRKRSLGAWLAALLAVHWAWAGIAYHGRAFATINPAARLFAVFFVIQAFAFVWTGVIRGSLAFAWGSAWRHWLAALLLLTAIVYPGAAWLTVAAWPRIPTFGVPCPTALFTAGRLLSARLPFPRWLFVIPVLWSLIGGSAALMLGVEIDLSLFVAAAGLLVFAVTPRLLDRPGSG
jgi:hypothetical protein